jgi:hypothetical protein
MRFDLRSSGGGMKGFISGLRNREGYKNNEASTGFGMDMQDLAGLPLASTQTQSCLRQTH